MKAHTVVGSYVGSLAELHSLMAIARDGRLPPLPVTTRPLAQATQALEDLRQGKVRGRTILLP
jgi:D-arabinose 1-dehydrogenase-like Zn-dependent alcohol dehydrogenase